MPRALTSFTADGAEVRPDGKFAHGAAEAPQRGADLIDLAAIVGFVGRVAGGGVEQDRDTALQIYLQRAAADSRMRCISVS